MENKGERVFDEDITARIIKHSRDTAMNADPDGSKTSRDVDTPFKRRPRRAFPTGVVVVSILLVVVLLMTAVDPKTFRKKVKRRRWF